MESLADSNQRKIFCFVENRRQMSRFGAESKKPVEREESENTQEVTHHKVPRNFKEPPLSRKKKYYLLWDKRVRWIQSEISAWKVRSWESEFSPVSVSFFVENEAMSSLKRTGFCFVEWRSWLRTAQQPWSASSVDHKSEKKITHMVVRFFSSSFNI